MNEIMSRVANNLLVLGILVAVFYIIYLKIKGNKIDFNFDFVKKIMFGGKK